jgi:hypothetical protein
MNRSTACVRGLLLAALAVAISLVAAGCGRAGGGGASAPTVVATVPANGATGVATTSAVTVTFSTAMNPATTQTAFSVDPVTDCTFSWNAAGTALTCTPTSDLAANTAHVITLATTATSAGGTPIAAASTFAFTTGAFVSESCVLGASRFGACRLGP